MMESDLREAQMKRAMAETAARKVALVDHAKFGDAYIATSLLPEELDLLIVDQGLSKPLRQSLEAAQITTEYV